MRAHASKRDLAGVRHEWQCYERVIAADPWSDGEPATKLVELRHQLLSPNGASDGPRFDTLSVPVSILLPGRSYQPGGAGMRRKISLPSWPLACW